MSDHLAPRHLVSDLPEPRAVLQDIESWHHDTHHRDQDASALDASDDAQHSAASVLQSSQMCAEKFRRAERVEHFAHYFYPPAFRARGHSTTSVPYSALNFRARRNFRFRAAPCVVPIQEQRANGTNCTFNSTFVGATPDETPASAKCPQPRAEAGHYSSFAALAPGETAATTINLTGKQIVAADNYFPCHQKNALSANSASAISATGINSNHQADIGSLS